jgi:hypothetical protein
LGSQPGDPIRIGTILQTYLIPPEPAPPKPQRAWAESHARCPLICLLSPGSDPTKLIEDLAKRKKIKTLGVSMGQGQEVRVPLCVMSAPESR